jgi:thiopeptide-type bacteriocin biosynthesis protein
VIGDAETLFCSDTETSVLLIRGILSKKITFPDYIVAALSCVDILKGFGLDLDAQIAFFERLGIEKKALEGFRKWKSVLLSAASVLFGSGSPKENEEEMAYLLQAFEKRKAAQEIYLKKLQDALGSSPAVLDKIFGSILHMHCNRMLGTQPDLEKKAMAFAAHALASFAQLKLENATPKPLGNCKLGRLLN